MACIIKALPGRFQKERSYGLGSICLGKVINKNNFSWEIAVFQAVVFEEIDDLYFSFSFNPVYEIENDKSILTHCFSAMFTVNAIFMDAQISAFPISVRDEPDDGFSSVFSE